VAGWREIRLVLRGLGWVLLLTAVAAGAVYGYARLRLGEHRLPGVSALDQRLLWDKDDLYGPEGRRYLALCGWAFELLVASAVTAALLLAVLPAAPAD
jgi:hypothetical protein